MGWISDIITNISAFRIKIGEKLNTLRSWIGNLPSLTTTHKTDIVGAINEVNGKSFTQAKQLRTYYLRTDSYNNERKLRLYLDSGFAGSLKLEITGGYNSGNTNGEIVIQGGLGVNVGSFLWSSQLNCTNSRGYIRSWIYIKPEVLFDSANGRAYIEINKKNAGDNDYAIKLTLFSHSVDLTTMQPYLVDMGTGNVSNETNEVYYEGKISVYGGDSDLWNSAVQQLGSKVNNWDVATAIGFISSNADEPYFYHAPSGGFTRLAPKDWVISNFVQQFQLNNYVPTSHPVYNITQAYINGWQTYLGYWDNRQIRPSDINVYKMQFGFGAWDNNNVAEWADFLHFGGYSDGSGGNQNLIMFKKMGFGLRQFQGTSQSPSVYASSVDYWHTGILPNPATETYVNQQIQQISLTPGAPGTNATITGVSATVTNTVGAPAVSVSMGGTASNRTFQFAFSNLKGDPGTPGVGSGGIERITTDSSSAPGPADKADIKFTSHVEYGYPEAHYNEVGNMLAIADSDVVRFFGSYDSVEDFDVWGGAVHIDTIALRKHIYNITLYSNGGTVSFDDGIYTGDQINIVCQKGGQINLQSGNIISPTGNEVNTHANLIWNSKSQQWRLVSYE